jgi:hypothetical protein
MQEEQMEKVPYVPCPFSCDGWLISSQHRECFHRDNQVWRFACPNCHQHFEVHNLEIKMENISLNDARRKYPRFRLGRAFLRPRNRLS